MIFLVNAGLGALSLSLPFLSILLNAVVANILIGLGIIVLIALPELVDYPSLHNILRASRSGQQEAGVHAVQASFVSRPEMIQPHGP